MFPRILPVCLHISSITYVCARMQASCGTTLPFRSVPKIDSRIPSWQINTARLRACSRTSCMSTCTYRVLRLSVCSWGSTSRPGFLAGELPGFNVSESPGLAMSHRFAISPAWYHSLLACVFPHIMHAYLHISSIAYVCARTQASCGTTVLLELYLKPTQMSPSAPRIPS